MTMARFNVDRDLSAITIPKTGLSLQGIAAASRRIVPGWRHEVSGEFTESGTTLYLRVRLNGNFMCTASANAVNPESADALIGNGYHGAAFKLVQYARAWICDHT